ncbi:MAG: rhomboid family intramembrane serine protease [Bacteroidota bacterium]|nr:rhomboid family intramembrane serine protease [Bacteroidota bacterium]
MGFWEQIKAQFKQGSVLTRLIYINLGVFVILVAWLILSGLGSLEKTWLQDFLAFPANFDRAILKPWSFVTYMFTQINFFHLIFNLIALFWFGRMFMNWLDENRLLAVYVLGGLSGAAMYLISYQIFPGLAIDNKTAQVVGASASIYAIMLALLAIAPRFKIMIPLIASFELRQLVLVFLMIDVFSIAFSQNIGGHLAHFGGAIFGYVFGILHKQGFDITTWFTVIIRGVMRTFKSNQQNKVHFTQINQTRHESDMDYNARKTAEQEDINRILDKIGNSGYDSLTKREKEILFKSSHHQK